MANIRNIDAESGANFIGDDAQPTLSMSNSSTGPGLQVDSLVVTSNVTVTRLDVGTGILAANATIAALNFSSPSRASGAVMNLKGQSFVSAVSIVFAASANWAGMGAIRVVRSDGTFGWIPVLPSAVVTAAAVE